MLQCPEPNDQGESVLKFALLGGYLTHIAFQDSAVGSIWEHAQGGVPMQVVG